MVHAGNVCRSIVIAAFIAGTVLPAAASAGGDRLPPVFRVAVVIPEKSPSDAAELNDLEAFKTSLTVAGIRFTVLHSERIDEQLLRGYDCLIVPHPSAERLNTAQIRALLRTVEDGCGLVLDGESPLSAALGVRFSSGTMIVREVKDLQFPSIPLYWKPVPVRTIAPAACQPLCIESTSGAPVAVRGRRGNGAFVCYSPLFDPESGRGYARFPFLMETLSAVFGYTPLAARKTAAMYFDPGSRNFEGYERLARLWRQRGIQRIYAGGWYDDRECNYELLVRACHENGIPVYCWLEPPMISKRFWDEHPGWREKTALHEDAHVDWRYLMDLSDPACRAAAFKEIAALLERYDWDGVNVAELYFESADGPKNAAGFTPMNDRVRRGFRERYGFDPAGIFEPSSPHYWKENGTGWKTFAAYRRMLCNGVKTDFLEFLDGIRRTKKDLDIVITAIDAALAPELEDYIAEDTAHLLALRKKYDLTLQVEDEWLSWSGKPGRYAALGERYRAVVPVHSLLEIDWNVVEDCHEEGNGGFPAAKPTGEEVRQVVYNIDLHHARPVFYAEDTLYEHDFRNITSVLARRTTVTPAADGQWEVSGPDMVTLYTGLTQGYFFLDGRRWNAGEGGNVIVPAGNHSLRWDRSGTDGTAPRLLDVSGELKEAVFDAAAVTFDYDAGRSSCYAVVDRRPESVSIDGRRRACPLVSSEAGFSLKLPPGRHRVKIITEK